MLYFMWWAQVMCGTDQFSFSWSNYLLNMPLWLGYFCWYVPWLCVQRLHCYNYYNKSVKAPTQMFATFLKAKITTLALIASDLLGKAEVWNTTEWARAKGRTAIRPIRAAGTAWYFIPKEYHIPITLNALFLQNAFAKMTNGLQYFPALCLRKFLGLT